MSVMQLKLSIIVPTKNSDTFLEEALDSILNQGYPNYEIIVIDGYSTDRTKSIAELYHNLQFYRLEATGEVDAINKGMSIASGDIVAFLDSDDVYLSGCFKAVNKAFQSNPKKQWLYGKGIIIDKNGTEVRSLVTTAKQMVKYSYKALMCVDFIVQPTVFMRRELFESMGNFDVKLPYSCEYEYWLRIGRHYTPMFLDRHLAAWRAHAGSISVKGYLDQTVQAREIQRNYSGKNWLLNRIQDIVYYGTRLLYRILN
jgi:glycosyltransferase involved in cell wall biosynthesis